MLVIWEGTSTARVIMVVRNVRLSADHHKPSKSLICSTTKSWHESQMFLFPITTCYLPWLCSWKGSMTYVKKIRLNKWDPRPGPQFERLPNTQLCGVKKLTTFLRNLKRSKLSSHFEHFMYTIHPLRLFIANGLTRKITSLHTCIVPQELYWWLKALFY